MYIFVQLCVNHITWNFWSYQNCEHVTCDCILTHTSNSELQWNPLKISQLTKFAHLRYQNNLVPKYSHMMNTYIALLICFPLKSISHLTCIKISWCKKFFNHLIYSCIKIPSVKFVPNRCVLVLHHQTQSGSIQLSIPVLLQTDRLFTVLCSGPISHSV